MFHMDGGCEVVRGIQLECWTHGRDASGGRFSKAQWQAHVLANLPFYSLLLPLFLEFTRSRVSFRCDESLEGLKRVRPPMLSFSAGMLFHKGTGLSVQERNGSPHFNFAPSSKYLGPPMTPPSTLL